MKQNSFIICQQNTSNVVSFITSELSESTSLFYNDFLKFLEKYRIVDFAGFLEELNTFKVILIEPDKHTWQIYKEEVKDVTFEKLRELNKDKIITKEVILEKDFISQIKDFSFNKTKDIKQNSKFFKRSNIYDKR